MIARIGNGLYVRTSAKKSTVMQEYREWQRRQAELAAAKKLAETPAKEAR